MLESHILGQVSSVKKSLEGFQDADTLLEEHLARFKARIAEVIQSIKEMREDLTLCKRAVSSGGATIIGTMSSPRVDYRTP